MRRFVEIDIARGLTIFLVVAGHTTVPEWLNNILRDFRMPLFFLVSGYLFSSQKYLNNTRMLWTNKFYTLLVPYFTAGILSYFYWIIIKVADPSNGEYIWYKPLVGVFYGNGVDGWLGLNEPIWFLVCLFCAQILYCYTQKIIGGLGFYTQAGIYMLIGFAGYAVSRVIFLPWGLDIALVALLFMYLGNKFKYYQFIEKLKPVGFVSVLSLIVFGATTYFNNADMNNRIYGNLFTFYIAGISGSILALSFTKVLLRNNATVKFFTLLGRESLLILIFHAGLAITTLSYVDILFVNGTVHWSVYLTIGLTLPLVLSIFIKKIPILNVLLNGKGGPSKSQKLVRGSKIS
ncbi:acyltransferase family protein [Peribacillus simplex]|uniref:Acyltransferase family protein n=2 Tax=Peribacillus TaxID=2675229 RepID=A0AA90PBB1_9BACI|nr:MULTISPECIES: acyltransferase family protein [Peribacillus]MDP1417437.1 acyltransferase family protein [Peribacillus simplex]MDP1450092.1 acyltransferase family protein [Peribacillus frigoritolerans]